MRWMRNTILIIVCLGLVIILYKSGDVTYTGFEVLEFETQAARIVINSPINNSVLNSSSVDINFTLTDWVNYGIGGNHTHFYLDGDSVAYMFYNSTGGIKYNSVTPGNAQRIDNDTIRFTSLGEGSHNVVAVLANGTHSELSNRTNVVFNISFTVTVGGNIPDFTLNEDTPRTNAFDLDDYFSGNSLNFVFNVDVGNSVTFDIASDKRVNITPVANWNGVVNANVSVVSNNVTINSSNNFKITVTPVGDPPILYSPIPTISWSGSYKRINLDDHFKEVDGERMTFFATPVENIDIIFSDNSPDVKFEQDPGWTGTKRTKIFANDTNFNTVGSNEFILNVTDSGIMADDGNTAPTISRKTPSSNSVSMNTGENFRFGVNATDSDGDTLRYSWKVNSILQSGTSNTFTFTTNSEGAYTIMVDVSDGWFTETETWTVTVIAPIRENTSSDVDTGAGSTEPRQETRIIQKPKGSFTWVIITIIIASLAIIGALTFKLISKRTSKSGTMLEIKGSEGKPGEISDIENEFLSQLKGEELKPVIDFIKKYKLKGVSNEEIKNVLSRKGWKKNLVDDAFMKI